MNFTHTDDRRMLSDSLGRFIADRYDIDTRHKIAGSPQGYSPNRWQSFADLGAIAALLPEAHGGLGGTGQDIAVVFEALGRGLVLEPFLPTAVLAASALAHAGSAEQRALLANVVDGTLIMSLAHEEPQSHYELTQVRTQAVREGAHWVIRHGGQEVARHEVLAGKAQLCVQPEHGPRAQRGDQVPALAPPAPTADRPAHPALAQEVEVRDLSVYEQLAAALEAA